jgi:hypothetical protein
MTDSSLFAVLLIAITQFAKKKFWIDPILFIAIVSCVFGLSYWVLFYVDHNIANLIKEIFGKWLMESQLYYNWMKALMDKS